MNFTNILNNLFNFKQKIYAHRSILSIILKNKVDTLLKRFQFDNDLECHSDLIELVIFYCYTKCLDPEKQNYLSELVHNKDCFLNVVKNIEQLDGLVHLINVFEKSVSLITSIYLFYKIRLFHFCLLISLLI